jgi:hypothetical protein
MSYAAHAAVVASPLLLFSLHLLLHLFKKNENATEISNENSQICENTLTCPPIGAIS